MITCEHYRFFETCYSVIDCHSQNSIQASLEYLAEITGGKVEIFPQSTGTSMECSTGFVFKECQIDIPLGLSLVQPHSIYKLQLIANQRRKMYIYIE